VIKSNFLTLLFSLAWSLSCSASDIAYFDRREFFHGETPHQQKTYLSLDQAHKLFRAAQQVLSIADRGPFCAVRSEYIVQLAKRRYGVDAFKVWGMYWRDEHTPFDRDEIQRLVSINGLGESDYHSTAIVPVMQADGRIENLVFDANFAQSFITFREWTTYFSQATGGSSPLRFMLIDPKKITPGKRAPVISNSDERFREVLRILRIDTCAQELLEF